MAVGDHRGDGQCTDRKFEPVGIDARDDHAIVDRADKNDTDDRTEYGSNAASEGCASDYRRSDA